VNGSEGAEIGQRLAAIRDRIGEACRRAGRDVAEVTLVGVSKRQPLARVRAAIEAGLDCLGENQVQEGCEKIPLLPAGLDWHFIGTLQSNKARLAVRFFDTIHSLDRLKIAQVLEHEAERQGRRIQGFIQVHLGDERSKHGFLPESLVENLRPLAGLRHLEIVGLMTLPPFEADPEAARRWFRQLRETRDRLAAAPEWQGFKGWLSMGMSHDFEIAIEEGATHVRVGTSIFGRRPSAN